MAKTRILVVENEHIVAEDIKESLQILGYAVPAIAYSKDEAVEKAQETNPDLVLMDIVLKGETSGLEAAGIIRSRLDIPVVYLTAYADEKTLEQAKITEAFGYIIKPFKDRELYTAIEMALYKHKMERRLKEREEWLSTILASIGDAVIATDMKGRIIFMNPIAEFLIGWKQEDVIGTPLKEIFKIVNEKTHKPVEDPVEKVLREGIIVGLANHSILIAKDETERPIDDSGAPIRDDKGNVTGVVLVFRDVSERRKTENALKQSEERYRTLFEDSRDAIYITTREGMFVDANQSMFDLFGYSREEMIGLDARTIYVNPDDRNIFQKEIEQTGSVKEYRVKLCKKDGTKIDCLLTSSVRQDDGSILGYQGIIHDITERKRIEAKLQQSQKLESIGTLAGGIAHDFNNLLMGIQGHVSLISLNTDPHHPNFQHLKGIEAAVKNGVNLTRQLLGFARGGKYQTKVIDLNKLIQINSEMFGRTKKEINIHTKYQKDLWPVEVDPGQIDQVMLNLYINAWQAMSRMGDLYIETSNFVINKNDAKSFEVKAGNYVKISVADTGVGMDKATMQRIFDPFYTTKVMGRGTGLGLASAYGIIKNHGGIINVYSEKGSGAIFEIFLPASEKQVIIEEKKPAAGILMGTQTILLVDDEDMILNVGEEMLRELGYTVMLAKSGNEAVKAYKKHKDEIDLVILDMIMPDISGSDVYDRIKKINPKIKVLLSSGYSVTGEANEILERGCNGFIQKPFNLTTLSIKIGEILELS
jgi:two-component system cell cycle sensor histidine kinase/response regulator CckA